MRWFDHPEVIRTFGEWDESKHPRDDKGQFGESQGGSVSDPPGTWYHGTSSAHLPAIQTTGLKPSVRRLGHLDPPGTPESHVSVTQNRERARGYAAMAVDEVGGTPVVLALDLADYHVRKDAGERGGGAVSEYVTPKNILRVEHVTGTVKTPFGKRTF